MQIEIGKVYVKYRCGHILHDNGHSVRVADRTNRFPSGNPKKIIACPICRNMGAGYEYRFKICPECMEIRWAKLGRLQEGRCKVCGREDHRKNYRAPKTTSTVGPTYFQAGKQIEKPRRVISKLDCTHRTQCLPFQPGGVLHCGGCKRYERIERDWTGCTRHDDTIWALGA
jgi:hypothetical protein